MRAYFFASLLLSCIGTSLVYAEESKPVLADTIVICPEHFQPTLNKWVGYRQQQGHSILVLTPEKSAAATREKIIQNANKKSLKHILLVGDSSTLVRPNQSQPDVLVPTHFIDAIVNVKFGSEKQIATDNPYADFNNDGIPEFAIGRITPDSNRELATIIEKIINYESHVDFAQWRKKIHFIAGMGGFGKIEDSILETATKQFITKGIPDGYETTMTYASWQSPYCPDPRLFQQQTCAKLNDGCLLWIYVGHGHVQQLDQMNVSGVPFRIFDVRDVPRVKAQSGLPIAVFLACYTAAFDARFDCLAEELLRREGGPVAVLGGTRVTLPYAMSVMSLEMLNAYFQDDIPTLGEVLLYAKQEMVKSKPAEDHSLRQIVDSLAQVLSPTKNMLEEERMENLQVFHLIGDPLLRIKRPKIMKLVAEERRKPGEFVTVTGIVPEPGMLTVELAYPRDRLTFRPEKRNRVEWTDEFMNKLQKTYEQANDRTLRKQSFQVPKGPFKLSIPIPSTAQGSCEINAFLQSATRCALGSVKLMVR